ncbi:MAG TPA: D-alanyl-D-alanine carboxypeptidase family protein [Mobilitalea sp.]|nr:D-alanyl-D-alanine carboxypeptidase family protein [Mobilitalea sp.]
MKTITFHKNDIHKGSLILINKLYPLVCKEIGRNISMIPAYLQSPEILLEVKTAAVLTHLIGLLRCQEDILPVSGYRSYEEQQRIYTDSLVRNGREFTEKYVALPDQSEHQTGLAIDLALKQDNIDFIRPEFPYEGICNIFRERAPFHGFVERYQRGKEEVTGIAHEPWHFRYVGYPHSVIMTENNLVLEEYMEIVKSYPYDGEHLITNMNQQTIEIFYVNASSTLTEIELPDDSIYQISGNNMDGFIVTLWW